MGDVDAPALRIRHRYISPTVGLVVDQPSLRRAELAFWRTTYKRVVVDERVLTRRFPTLQPPSRLTVLVLLEGRFRFEHEGELHEVAPGEAWLGTLGSARFEDATFLNLEWTSSSAASLAYPVKLRSPDPERLRRVASGLDASGPSQHALLDDTFDLLRAIGAPLDLHAAALEGGPSARDERIARAMEAQLASLSTKATALHLGEDAALSPRQLQRVVHAFNLRYGINAGNWRDTKNRWRIQVAAVLLSLPELSIGAIAEEVGYGTGASMARAFAAAGFPPPGALREEVLSGRAAT